MTKQTERCGCSAGPQRCRLAMLLETTISKGESLQSVIAEVVMNNTRKACTEKLAGHGGRGVCGTIGPPRYHARKEAGMKKGNLAFLELDLEE